MLNTQLWCHTALHVVTALENCTYTGVLEFGCLHKQDPTQDDVNSRSHTHTIITCSLIIHVFKSPARYCALEMCSRLYVALSSAFKWILPVLACFGILQMHGRPSLTRRWYCPKQAKVDGPHLIQGWTNLTKGCDGLQSRRPLHWVIPHTAVDQHLQQRGQASWYNVCNVLVSHLQRHD